MKKHTEARLEDAIIDHLTTQAGYVFVDYREGDEILTELWFKYHAERLGREQNIPVDEALIERVRREYPIPSIFDFRMNVPKSS